MRLRLRRRIPGLSASLKEAREALLVASQCLCCVQCVGFISVQSTFITLFLVRCVNVVSPNASVGFSKYSVSMFMAKRGFVVSVTPPTKTKELMGSIGVYSSKWRPAARAKGGGHSQTRGRAGVTETSGSTVSAV